MKLKILSTAVVAMSLVFELHAAPTLDDPSLWNAGAATWAVTDTPLSSANPVPGTGAQLISAGTTATILFPGGGAAPGGRLSATSGNFIGNLQPTTPALSVRFTFNSLDVAPNQTFGSLALYFKTLTDTWYYQLTPPAGLGDQNYTVLMSSQGSWFRTAGAGGYFADLASVTEFGFEVIGGNSFVDQSYEIKDVFFTATVPEPETVWMILMVLASLGITFRGRLGDIMGQIKARVKA